MKAYKFEGKIYVPSEDNTSAHVFSKDTGGKTVVENEYNPKIIALAISMGKDVSDDLTKKDYEEMSHAMFAAGNISAAKEFDKEARKAPEKGGHSAFESENINRHEKKTEKEEYDDPELIYAHDPDSGDIYTFVGYGKNAKYQRKETEADIRGDLGEKNTANRDMDKLARNDWVPEEVAEANGLDDYTHGDMKPPEEEAKEHMSLKDLEAGPPTFITRHYDEQELDEDDPVFSDPRWET